MCKLTQKICLQCDCQFVLKRNPNQKYCDQKACQNARKRKWRNEKLERDPDYRENRNAASKRWREKNSAYWRKYRATHQEYSERNRKLRRESKHNSAKLRFANSDASEQKTLIKTGTYKLVPNDCKFANSDALIVNISVISRGYEKEAQFANIPPYSQPQ